LLADLLHMNIEEESLQDSIIVFWKSIGHMHFANPNRHPVGMVHLPVAEIGEALKSICYDGYISVEALSWRDPDSTAVQTILSIKEYFA